MYSKDVNDVYKELNTSEKGLTINEVNKRLNIYDKNIIKEKKKENIFLRFLKQFKDIMIMRIKMERFSILRSFLSRRSVEPGGTSIRSGLCIL